VAPIQTTAEVLEHAQTHALGIIETPPDDEIGLVGLPLSFDGKRAPPLHAARDIGADNPSLEALLKTSR
jgi:crotonobetainyl-CoA:carnitine CoA-transferase CaiB-like acyl-CoA transferase